MPTPPNSSAEPPAPPTPETPPSPATPPTSPSSDRAARNAFTREFLARLDDSAEPDGAHEAHVAGPWSVRPVPYQGGTGFALLRDWERLEDGDDPYAIFRHRETAVLAAAVLPATGRDPLFRLHSEPDTLGFPLRAAGEAPFAPGLAPADAFAPASSRSRSTARSPSPSESDEEDGAAAVAAEPLDERAAGAPIAGHLRDFDEELAAALHLVAALVRSPVALARLLEAAGFLALEQAGRILDQSIRRPR